MYVRSRLVHFVVHRTLDVRLYKPFEPSEETRVSEEQRRGACQALGSSKQRVVARGGRSRSAAEGSRASDVRRLAGALGAGAMSALPLRGEQGGVTRRAASASCSGRSSSARRRPTGRSAIRRQAVSARAGSRLRRPLGDLGLLESRTHRRGLHFRRREAVTCLPAGGWLLPVYVCATRRLVARQLCLPGFALQEASLPESTQPIELADMVEDVYLPQLPPDGSLPQPCNSAAALVAAGYGPAGQFIFSLDLVLRRPRAPEEPPHSGSSPGTSRAALCTAVPVA